MRGTGQELQNGMAVRSLTKPDTISNRTRVILGLDYFGRAAYFADMNHILTPG